MIPDFDLSKWHTQTEQVLGAMNSYRKYDQETTAHMKNETDGNTKLIIAGARACMLAHQALGITFPDTREGRRNQFFLHEYAELVLKSFGVAIERSPDYVDREDQPKEEEVLRWPPRVPTLPNVYQENPYITRHACTAKLERSDGTEQVFELAQNTVLRFTGASWFKHDLNCWVMRMTCEHALLDSNDFLLVHSTDIRAEDP